MKGDDRQLLLRMHKGHEASARELWSRHSRRLLAYARSIAGCGAEDVVQSVFMAVLAEPRRTIKGVRDPAAWLMVLTRRCALNQLRGARREGARGRAMAMARGASGPTTPIESDVSRALGSLPRRLREVVVLRHVAGLSFDQVATALGANRNTAAARYREAIRRLRILLGDEQNGAALVAATEGAP